MKEISSIQNDTFKSIVKLDKKRNREKSSSFLIEGIREVQLAIQSGVKIRELIFNTKALEEDIPEQFSSLDGALTYHFADEIFGKIAYRDRVANVIGVATIQPRSVDELADREPKLIVVLESVEKPGNLGAIFRTCDAAGVDAVLICNQRTDIYHPNVIRASLGSIFSTPFYVCTNEEAKHFLETQTFGIYTTYLEGSVPHFEVDMSEKTALVLGSEAEGVSMFWVQAAKKCIKIPMNGQVDSMNVSTAAAVVIYEAVRQQNHSVKE